MGSEAYLLFPPFRFGQDDAQLWREDEKISLRPKSFEVLRYLLEHHGKLVTKSALLDAVWPNVSVSDNLPATSIRELRKALGDKARTPRFIETVQRRGYRFIAPVLSTTEVPTLKLSNAKATPEPQIVGREVELSQFRQWLDKVHEGKRITLFVTGEAGIGKTSCVERFLNSISPFEKVRIGRGQCIEQYGAGEPYMPVLEALSRLARQLGATRVRDVLARYAPTWLLQMPELATRIELGRSQSEMQSLSQQRMLREGVQALEALANEETLVLVVEDLHWSDFSTLELISAIARRKEPARLMIVGTYRPAEIHIDKHLQTIKEELELHGNCKELRLKLLGRSAIRQYLKQRMTEAGGSLSLDTLASIIQGRTEGNPLFMVNLIDYLAEHELLIKPARVSKAEWTERIRLHPVNALSKIPQIIERNVERLKPSDQAVLEAASIAGIEFSAALVAAALARPQTEIEACCLRLSRHAQFINAQDPVEWPDGTVATKFGFHHALYQEVLYERVSAGQRAQFHRLIAARLEEAYQGRAAEVSAELADHYRRANLKLEAIHYLQLAGQRAISLAAVNEARDHFAQAIKLLDELPGGQVRDRQELDLHLAITPALVAVIGGWSAPETERAWARAMELCERLGESAQFPALFGMFALYNVRGKISRSNGLAKQLVSRTETSNDSAQTLYARLAMAVSSYFIGDFTSALESAENCIAIYDFERHRGQIDHYGMDAGVWGLCFAAAAYWQLGYPDTALARSEGALALARKHAHPLSLAQAELWTGILRQMRGEPQLVGEISDRLITLAADHGLTDWLYWAECLKGWAVAMQGSHEKGIERIRENQRALEARGLRVWQPYLHCLLAEGFLAANQVDDGIRALQNAIAAAEEGQERAHESQIYRLLGDSIIEHPASDRRQAQTFFERAIEAAHRQSAKSFELQAATSLARFLAKEGKRTKARATLEDVYRSFNEGFDTKDLKDARALLVEFDS